jgi:hypothetical protein
VFFHAWLRQEWFITNTKQVTGQLPTSAGLTKTVDEGARREGVLEAFFQEVTHRKGIA